MTYVDGAWNSVQSLFEGVAQELEENPTGELEEELDNSKNVGPFQKFNFSWSPTQKSYLHVIKSSAADLVAGILAEPIFALDDLYKQARVVEKDAKGNALRDEYDNLVWKKGSDGEPLEDWASVTNQDIEMTLLKFQEIKMKVTDSVSDLFLEACLR